MATTLGQIVELSAHKTPFQWKNYRYPSFEGHPDVAFAANGDAVIVYQGTSDEKIFYVVGPLANDGSINGDERLLDMGLHDYA